MPKFKREQILDNSINFNRIIQYIDNQNIKKDKETIKKEIKKPKQKIIESIPKTEETIMVNSTEDNIVENETSQKNTEIKPIEINEINIK